MGNDEVHLGLLWSKTHPDKGFEGLRPLTSSEAAEIGEAARVLNRFANRPMFALQSELYRSAREAIEMLAAMPTTFGPNQAARPHHEALGNRLALWLQATRMFLDQSETAIKRTYGETSAEWSRWESLKHRLHASHVGYDLLYAVRNALHTAPIPLYVSVSARLDGDQIRQTADIRLDVEALRTDENMDRWFRQHADIGDDDLQVESLLVDMQTCMEELKKELILMDTSKARVSADTIRRYAEEAFESGDPSASWPITFSLKTGTEPLQVSNVSFLPIDLLSYVPDSDTADFRIRGDGMDEIVGSQGVNARRASRWWATVAVVTNRRSGKSATGRANLWAYTTGSGWGGTVLLEDFIDVGPVQVLLATGQTATATLVAVDYQGTEETTIIIGTLVGQGPAPPSEILSHEFRQ